MVKEKANDPITSDDVRARELAAHVGKAEDSPLVALSLSGGGIRSATFGLGALQALRSLGFFKHLDYVSTVSGGGYIGGWLQAAIARDCLRAIELKGEEPREIRFLRGYSNYLTPKLGLFSGDTWAAIGNSARNLVLNFTILSLSLMAPLYLPWLAAASFWRIVPEPDGESLLLAITAALYTLVIAASSANMARPVRNGGWTKSGASVASPAGVYLMVIAPGLVATWLGSAVMWSWARHGDFREGGAVLTTAWHGALAYGGVWVVGLLAGFSWRQWRSPRDGDTKEGVDYIRAARAAVVLVVTAMMGGWLGTLLIGLMTDALAYSVGNGPHSWLLGQLSFPIGVTGVLLGASAHIGLAGKYMSDETREWWGRVGGVQFLIALLLIALGVLALVGPHTFDVLRLQWSWLADYQGPIKSVVAAVWAGLTGAGVWAGRSDRTATGGGNPLLEFAGRVAPVTFVLGYLLILATIMHAAVPQFSLPLPGGARYTVFRLCDVESSMRQRSGGLSQASVGEPEWDESCGADTAPAGNELGGLLLMLLASGALAFAISWRVDLNEFSLHTFYRNRLVRCFLGASRKRNPHPFTGFDAEDDLPLAAQLPGEPGRPMRPYPIFNTAINLVGGKNLAWQERKAASFIFTPEYCGFEYRDDDDPPVDPRAAAERAAEDTAVQRKADDSGVVTMPARAAGVRRLSAYARTSEHASDPRSLTMGLAIATSGAAASPNMGYHSSPTLAFLMTVFNVRLGWWLRNPRYADVWAHAGRNLSLREMLYELLGMTTDDKKWVYLSDGGHFENLGVYELVRRRCRYIIACDAGQDGAMTFEDLGNAIEKCRADFGVDIDIDLTKLRRDATGRSEWHCAVGTIRYDRLPPFKEGGAPEVPGTLIYIKSSLTGDEPADVLRYAAEHAAFPHESTNDQFFDESQFESYRALGFHAMRDVFTSALNDDACGTLEPVEIFTLLRQRWSKPAPAPADAIRKYSGPLERIWTLVRTSEHLKFLDSQMFPEMPALMAVPYDGTKGGALDRRPLPRANYWLPTKEAERREGFYACVEMLQLMEDVFLDFELDEYYDHIDNRGWMNLFQHWAWSGMLCATWAMVGSTFDPRFQRFCWRRLDLRPGVPSVAGLEDSIELPEPAQWREWHDTKAAGVGALIEEWQKTAGLNFWETELVSKYLRASRHEAERLFPVYVTVESPRRSDGNPFRFNVGYVIGEVEVPPGEAPRFSLHYMRIQNHLRKMGLARDALLALRRTIGADLYVGKPRYDPTVANGTASDEGIPSQDAIVRLRGIIRSLPRA